MSDISELVDELSKKSNGIIESGKSYQSIVQEVMVIGGKAMISKKFTLEQAEYVAASMIAAIYLAKSSKQ